MGKSPIRKFQTGQAIQRLSWTGSVTPERNLYWWYSLLCDYVHPNFGATNFFVDQMEVIEVHSPERRENRLYRRKLSRQPQDFSALAHVLTMLYIPVREALTYAANQLTWLADEQRKRERDLRVFRKRLSS